MTIRAGVAAGNRLLALPTTPDAVFCTNDLLAIGVIRTFTQFGLACPTTSR